MYTLIRLISFFPLYNNNNLHILVLILKYVETAMEVCKGSESGTQGNSVKL